ncbi:MAG: hypothetical protein H6556_28450 [Lewinellaceae bacterium]|nr:hypothetical protein [Lewinellaceae bacterium]
MINLSDTLALEKMPIVGARAIGVLVAIAKFMNEHNQSWPSRKTLRALTGLGRDALDKDIALLEKHQLAHKTQRRTSDGRRLSSNQYTIPPSLARKYTPPAPGNTPGKGCANPQGQDTGFQGTEFQGTGSQDTEFQDTGFQHPENPPGSIEYPSEELNKKEELNKQEELRALYARAREEVEKLKQENEELRRRLSAAEAGGVTEPAPPPGCGAPPPGGRQGETEAEPQFDTPTRTHTQAAEAFWAWALDNGYLPGIIANARYPGSQEQARDCCYSYFRNHQKNGRWIYIWNARSSKNLAGFESWLVKDPLFYPQKYRDEKANAPGQSGIWDPAIATEAFLELCAEEGIGLSGYSGVQH